MMSKVLIVLVLMFFVVSGCKVRSYYTDSQPISHDLWNDLMQKHINADGWLDYQGIINDSAKFNEYLQLLNSNHPNPKTWTRDERLAYWINAYNAYTVELILKHYPVESIKDIKKGVPFVNSVWDIDFIEIQGVTYSLNNIEHGILRAKFNEPRIHFAINCASYSCPVLRSEAFVADRIEEQLKSSTIDFLTDERRNKITENSPGISSIFKWFKGDFTKEGSLLEFLQKHSPTPISNDADIEFLDYDWRLNDSSTL